MTGRGWPLGLALLLLLAASCSPVGVPPTLGPTGVVPTLKLTTFIPTRPPTATATPTPSLTPTLTSTATPTATPTATSTPAPTATRCAETVGQMVQGTFPSPVQGIQQRYRIYLPPCYGQSGRLYPTLYLFHGNVYTESHWDDLGVAQAAGAGRTPFLIVLPFGGEIANATSGGDWSFEGVVMNELIPFIEQRYCAWPAAAGRAIGGISRGGYWSLEIGFRHPEHFAAVGGHSAALFYNNAGPVYNPLTTGANPRLSALPIYLDIGERDWLRQGVFDLHALLETAGAPHAWQLNPGAHQDAYWQEHMVEYLAWYASHWPAQESEYPSAAGRLCAP